MHHPDTTSSAAPAPAPANPVSGPDAPCSPVCILGLPRDGGSSFLRGSARAPAAIRRALFSPSINLCSEDGLDLRSLQTGGGAATAGSAARGADARPALPAGGVAKPGGSPPVCWQDLGDCPMPDEEAGWIAAIEEFTRARLQQGRHLLFLGGDHSVTYPVLRAYGRHFPGLTILHLDAHPDLYDELYGDRFSHACPFARILEEGLAAKLIQAGIRTWNPHQRAQAKRFGVTGVDMKDWHSGWRPPLEGPVYLSLDLDVLDPAFAPGVSHWEPGGLSTREVIDLIRNMGGRLVGADLVELNPLRDEQGRTAMTAAKLLKEMLARLIHDFPAGPASGGR